MGQFSVEKPGLPGSVLSGNQQSGDFRSPVFALALDAGEDVFDPIGAIDVDASLGLADPPVHLSVIGFPKTGKELEAQPLEVLPVGRRWKGTGKNIGHRTDRDSKIQSL